jgi:hypothetical protein
MGPVYVHVGTEEDVTLGWLVVVAVLVFGTVVYSPSESRADTNPQGVGQRPAQSRAHPSAAIVMGVAAVCIGSAIACSATGYGWLRATWSQLPKWPSCYDLLVVLLLVEARRGHR